MITKLRLNSTKAYLQIDFAFAIFIFVTILFSFFFVYGNFEEKLEVEKNIIQHKSLSNDLCFLLSNTQGIPINWTQDINNTIQYGLYDKNLKQISHEKYSLFANSSNYYKIQNTFNTSLFYTIKIFNSSSNNLMTRFGSTPDFPDFLEVSRCYSIYNDTPAYMQVEVWS